MAMIRLTITKQLEAISDVRLPTNLIKLNEFSASINGVFDDKFPICDSNCKINNIILAFKPSKE